MILDKENELSGEQAITATAASTNQIDLGPNSSAGNSNGACVMHAEVTIKQTFTAGGAATLAIAVRSSANADMSSPKVHYTTPALALAALTAGAKIPMHFQIPYMVDRYVDFHYTVASGPMTAGKISAVLGFGPQSQ